MKLFLRIILLVAFGAFIITNFIPPNSNTTETVSDTIKQINIDAQAILNLFQIVGASDTVSVTYERERVIKSAKYRLTIFGIETGVKFGDKYTKCILHKKYVFNIIAMTSKFTFNQIGDTLCINYSNIQLKTEYIKQKYEIFNETGVWGDAETDAMELICAENAKTKSVKNKIIQTCIANIKDNFLWFTQNNNLKLKINNKLVNIELQHKPTAIIPLNNITMSLTDK